VQTMEEKIRRIAAELDGEVALAVKDLTTGRTLAYHADRKCPTASVIKLPILVHTLLLAREGALSLEETVTLTDADKTPGSGILTHLSAGLKLTLRDACMLMIALSDNTATNLVLDRIGIEGVNERMRELGLLRTKLFRKVYSCDPPVSEENRRYGLGVTTPREMVRLLTWIYEGRVGDTDTCAHIRHFLGAQQYRDGIPRLLPSHYLYQGKSGAVDRVRNDIGYVIVAGGPTIALAIFCQKLRTVLWTEDNPALLTIAKLSQEIVRCWAEERADIG
jgi:beta-lactamase class A